MPQDYTPRAQLPLDERGNPIQAGAAEHIATKALTTTAWEQIEVPEGVSGAELWAVASGAATTIAWMYGGSRAGAPVTGVTVDTGKTIFAHCLGAPYIYAKAVGAAADLQIKWISKEY